MKATYRGKQVLRNGFGDIIAIYTPVVELYYLHHQKSALEKWLETTGYNYDTYQDGSTSECFADVYVDDREEADAFLLEWKSAKKEIALSSKVK